MRILEIYLAKRGRLKGIVKKYQNLKAALHGHSFVRSRIAMALFIRMGSWSVIPA